MIIFIPVEEKSGGKIRYEAAGMIDAEGNYKVGMNGDNTGAVPGEYKVRVFPRELGELPESNSAQIPEIYRNLNSTPLTFKVEDKDNEFDVSLTIPMM
jgi:hypothetical protein